MDSFSASLLSMALSVRLADDDLRAVYTTLNVGDRVVLR
jgi:hypothetical protein